MGHARLAPSSADIWLHCPGSVTMQEIMPPEARDDGKEGTASHWAAGEILSPRPNPTAGQIAPNGVVLDQEMIEGAWVYTSALQTAAAGAPLAIEHQISMPSIHPACHGTTDAWYYLADQHHLHVWDYKYGWGIKEPYRNPQLTLYAVGAIGYLAGCYQKLVGEFMLDLKITLHIVQPRPFHILGSHREWAVPWEVFEALISALRAAANEALGPQPRCITGPHCRYCDAQLICPANRKSGMAAFEYIERALPEVMTPDALGQHLNILNRAKQMIEYSLNSIEAQAQAMIEGGAHIPGYTIESGTGWPVWNRPAEEVFALGDLMKLQLRKPQEPITPIQARKAGLPDELMKAYSKSGAKAAKLVPTNKSLAAIVFGQVNHP